MIRELVQHDHLPDYRVSLEDEIVPPPPPPPVAPGYDVYYLEQEWRELWVHMWGDRQLGFPAGRRPFCKKRHQMEPNPESTTRGAASVQPPALPIAILCQLMFNFKVRDASCSATKSLMLQQHVLRRNDRKSMPSF